MIRQLVKRLGMFTAIKKNRRAINNFLDFSLWFWNGSIHRSRINPLGRFFSLRFLALNLSVLILILLSFEYVMIICFWNNHLLLRFL